MHRRVVLPALLMSLVLLPSAAGGVELRFQSGPNANLFWMVDQVSQWDARYTTPAYREYWNRKVEFTEEDYVVLDQYARLRRKLARLDESAVRKETSPWVSLFGTTSLLPHERFALAFFETATVNDAAALLKLSPQEQQVIVGTLLHFARKLKDHYGVETAHLANFAQKANILITLADAGGFIEQLRSFFGIRGSLPATIPVNVLWSPPGHFQTAHMDYHILLPVSVDNSETDEAVLQHLSLAMQEVAQYLVAKLPPETLSKASAQILQECGFVNAKNPRMVQQALQVALGELLFLRERFPDLPARGLLVPWDSALEYPYAIDELARAYAASLREFFGQPGGFYPGFVGRAAEIHKVLFPPRPRFFASTGILFGDKESRRLFDGMFTGVDRIEIDIDDLREYERRSGEAPGRSSFIVVTARYEGNMYKALQGVKDWRRHSATFRTLRNASFIHAIREPGAGTVVVVRGSDAEAVRQLLVKLHTMEEMPQTPFLLK